MSQSRSSFFLIIFFVNNVLSDDCGIRKNSNLPRIVGGRPAANREFPWTVALERLEGDEYVHFCGATVISDRWIVTAAHCLYKKNVNRMRGVFGATDLTKTANTFTTTFVESVTHQAFIRESYENDIALLKTKDKIPSYSESNQSINKICLPEQNEEFFGRVYVSGWGRVDEDDVESDLLKVLRINLYDDVDCKSLYEQSFYPSLMLCAGFIKGRRDSCHGDSGGPLEKIMFDRSYLIGIVSFGRGCAREYFPGVYTEVAKYVNWIRQMTEGGRPNPPSPPPPIQTEPPTVTRGANKHTFRVLNRCAFNVWMSTLGNWGKSTPANGGFKLGQNEQNSFLVDKGWIGRFWGRTGCESGVCETGDCGKGGSACQGAGGVPPATLIEMVMDTDIGMDVYSISLADGFNLPISITPIQNTFEYRSNNEFDCKPASCPGNVNDNCPQDLAVKKNGKVVACKSACFAKQDDRFCCRNAYLQQSECLKSYSSTNYLTAFHSKCPQARTILYDTPKSTFSCKSKSNSITQYEIVFCPTS